MRRNIKDRKEKKNPCFHGILIVGYLNHQPKARKVIQDEQQKRLKIKAAQKLPWRFLRRSLYFIISNHKPAGYRYIDVPYIQCFIT